MSDAEEEAGNEAIRLHQVQSDSPTPARAPGSIFPASSFSCVPSALQISQLVSTGREVHGNVRPSQHGVPGPHVLDTRAAYVCGVGGGARVRGGRWGKDGPSLAHPKAPHFWGQVRQLRKMNGASLASPGNLLEKVERRREREGRKEGGSECSANYSRPLFSLLPSPSLFFSPVARSLARSLAHCRISTST